MILFLLSYLGGVLTIVSPCVLPVVPFVFARAGRPFAASVLPLLVGMALTFAAVATLAAVGGGWVVQANEYGRTAALVLLAVFGVMLLWPRLAEHLTRPLVGLGNRLTQPGRAPGRGETLSSFILGVATGLLWAPCAGPILGLILAGAALQGANARTSLLLFTYAAGAATSLAVALLIGGRVFAAMKRSLGAGEWIRRGLGAAVLAAVAAIALGADTGVLARLSLGSTTGIEQALLDRLHPRPAMRPGGAMQSNAMMSGAMQSNAMAGSAMKSNAMMSGAMQSNAMAGGAMKSNAMMGGAMKSDAMAGSAMKSNAMMSGAIQSNAMAGSAMKSNAMMSGAMQSNAMAGGAMKSNAMMAAASGSGAAQDALPIEGQLPPLTGAVAWLNSPPLTPQGLRGKVVLIDFWTYSCINCLRTLPYVRAWAQKYQDHGLVVIGVHTPEFAFEKNVANVRRAVKDLGVTYPVAVDSNYVIWNAFFNDYWPADYFVDAQGRIRGHQYGEGDYRHSELLIRQLLGQAGYRGIPGGFVSADGKGVEAAADAAAVQSPETYIGYARAQNFASPEAVAKDRTARYTPASAPGLNQWGLGGAWQVGDEKAVLVRAPGRIVFRFHARDLHLVLGPGASAAPIHFRVLLDGAAPGDDHGVDVDAAGKGVVTQQRLYQLIRQSGAVRDRTFTIEFLDPGVQAFSFTFG